MGRMGLMSKPFEALVVPLLERIATALDEINDIALDSLTLSRQQFYLHREDAARERVKLTEEQEAKLVAILQQINDEEGL